MDRVHYSLRDRIGWVRLDDGKANAIQRPWCEALHVVLDEAARDESRVLVLSGRPDFFSGGLDLKVLPSLDRDELLRTTELFVETMKRVFLYEKPIVAASAGHAIAGGMMLFLAADVRVAVDEPVARYGLNEATTGIPLTGGTLGLCEHAIPRAHQTELILHGRLVDAKRAHAMGVVDELTTREALLDRAEVRARALFDLDPVAYRLNKAMLREGAFEAAAARAEALAGDLPIANPFARIAR